MTSMRDPRRNLILGLFCIILGVAAGGLGMAVGGLVPSVIVPARLAGNLLGVLGGVVGIVLAIRSGFLASKKSEQPPA